MGRKKVSGSHRKVDQASHHKRRKKERANREIKERIQREFEFAERIQKEPGLTDLLKGGDSK